MAASGASRRSLRFELVPARPALARLLARGGRALARRLPAASHPSADYGLQKCPVVNRGDRAARWPLCRWGSLLVSSRAAKPNQCTLTTVTREVGRQP